MRTLRKTLAFAAGIVAAAILSGTPCRAQQPAPLAKQAVPKIGTFYCLSDALANARAATGGGTLLAPLPCPPRQGVIYPVSTSGNLNIFLADCRANPRVDTIFLSALAGLESQLATATTTAAAKASAAMSAMQMDGPPLPGDGGGGTNTDNGSSGFYGPEYTTNDVWMTVGWTNSGSSSLLNFTIHMPDTNSSWDLFGSTNLTTAGEGLNVTNWLWLGTTDLGQTSISIPTPWPDLGFFRLGNALIDSDGDGIPDAREVFSVHTSPTNADTDGDGLSDGWELANGFNPRVDESAQTGSRANFIYDSAGWLSQIIGTRSESVTMDNEGNVQSSQ